MAYFGVNEIGLVWLLLPRFQSKLLQLMNNYERRTGKRLVVVSGHRDRELQARTYADSLAAGGRDGQGYRAAPPGQSKHEYAAADLHVIGETAGDAAKDAASPYYKILAEEAEKVGLKSGLRFKGGLPDPYHIEDPASLATLAAEHAAYVRRLLWRAVGVVAALAVVAYIARRVKKRTGGTA